MKSEIVNFTTNDILETLPMFQLITFFHILNAVLHKGLTSWQNWKNCFGKKHLNFEVNHKPSIQCFTAKDVLETLPMVHLTSSIFQINNIMTELKELFWKENFKFLV